MELFDELCFIVLLKSVDIIPTEMVLLLALLTPVTWMVPDGCSAANIPFCFVACGDASECLVATFFFIAFLPAPKPFEGGLLRAIIPPVRPCG